MSPRTLLDEHLSPAGLSAQLRRNDDHNRRWLTYDLSIIQVSSDGRSALLHRRQVRRPFLRQRCSAARLIDLAHRPPLLHGPSPRAVRRRVFQWSGPAFSPLDKNCPFGLQHALGLRSGSLPIMMHHRSSHLSVQTSVLRCSACGRKALSVTTTPHRIPAVRAFTAPVTYCPNRRTPATGDRSSP